MTPSRYLIAGTTVQLSTVTMQPIPTPITIGLVDQFGNLTSDAQNIYTAQFNVGSPGTTRCGTSPTQPTVDGAAWSIMPSPSCDLQIPPNGNSATIYVWDTFVSTISLQTRLVRGDGFTIPTLLQNEYITPGPADYITIHHPFHLLPDPANGIFGPLGVGKHGVLSRFIGNPPVPLGVTLRDKFGNVAAGHPINQQYFSGLVTFGTTGGTATVTLTDLTNNPPTNPPIANAHLFLGAADPTPGVFNGLDVQDSLVENLQLFATSYANPAIYGYTNDVGRAFTANPPPSQRSDENIQLAGVVAFPQDLAPESDAFGLPLAAKQAVGQSRPVLRQGDGSIASNPNPVQMLRLSMQVLPSSTSTAGLKAQLSGLRVVKTGALDGGHVTELALYYDANKNGQFDPPPAGDVLVGTAAWDAVNGVWRFGDPAYGMAPLYAGDPNPVDTTIDGSNANPNYFLTLRLAATGWALNELPSSLGLRIPSPSYITFSTASNIGVALNNFSLNTATSPVQRAPAQIYTQASDINAWWSPPSLALTSYAYVNQGTSFVGIMKIKMWTPVFTGTLGRLRITHNGTGLDKDISRVRLYIDADAGGNPANGDGQFEFATDKEVTDPASPVSFGTMTPRSVDLALKIDPSNPNNLLWRTISQSTNTYFVVFDYAPSALPGATHGMQFSAADVIPLNGDGNVVSFSTFKSSDATVIKTNDQSFAMSGLAVSSASIRWSWTSAGGRPVSFSLFTSSGLLVASVSGSATSYVETGLSSATLYSRYLMAAYPDGQVFSGTVTIATPQLQSFLTGTSSGTLTSANGKTQLVIPPGNLAAGTSWLVSETPNQRPLTDQAPLLIAAANRTLPPALQGSTSSLTEFIVAVGGTRYTGLLPSPVTVKVPYPDVNNTGFVDGTSPPVRVESLQLYVLNEGSGLWEAVPGSTVDKVNKVVSGQIGHLSIFNAFGAGAVPGLSTARVYPVPYKPNGGNADQGIPYSAGDPNSGIIFDNLPADVTIKIYDVAGRSVASFNSGNSTGKLRWDARNDAGKDVASGGYLAVISSPGVSSITKKILIVR